MAGEPLTYWEYLKAAFNLKAPLPLLGYMPANKLALAGFAILGFGNPGFWLLGAAFEVAYLMFLSGNQRFQNLVRGQRLAEIREASSGREQEMLGRLDKNARGRYQRLVDRCRAILHAEDGGAAAEGLTGLKSEGLSQLLAIHLRLLNMQCRIRDTLAATRQDDLEEDIGSLEAKVAKEPEDSPVHRALQGTLDIQRARLENLNKSAASLKFIETELDRIEKQVSLISEEIAVSKNPEQISLSLDGVVQSIQGTTKWISDNSVLLDAVNAPSEPASLISAAPRQKTAQKG